VAAGVPDVRRAGRGAERACAGGGGRGRDARRLKTLENENSRLKRIVADLTLDNQALKELNSKNW
jgi:hypothetical protein